MKLKSHVVLKGPTNIGPRNKFFSFCVIGEDTPDLKYKERNQDLKSEQTIHLESFAKFIEELRQI